MSATRQRQTPTTQVSDRLTPDSGIDNTNSAWSVHDKPITRTSTPRERAIIGGIFAMTKQIDSLPEMRLAHSGSIDIANDRATIPSSASS